MADFLLVETEHGSWLLHAGTHALFEVAPEAAVRLNPNELGEVERPALAAIENDLAVLAVAGQLDDCNRRRLASADPLAGANLALNINLTAYCNLGCTYCFAEGGDYGRLKGKLNAETDVDAILAFIRGNAVAGDTVRFEFFGGEPMMNFEVIEALCNRSIDFGRETGIRFLYRISTNLTTRLGRRELELFEKFGFIVSVSIDGDEATHDRNRPGKNGRGSFRTIIENCRKVRVQSETITLVARMTYVPFPESSLIGDIRKLRDLNIFDWFQVLPATLSQDLLSTVFGRAFREKNHHEIRAVCADKVDREYAVLADRYLELFSARNRFRGLLEFETIIRMILRGEVANGHCSGGRNYFTFSPDGSIMPCHRLVGEADFQAAAFHGTPDDRVTAPWRRRVDETPVCADCSIRYICGGGCKQENLVGTGDINIPDPEKCRFQFRLVAAAVQSITRSGHAFQQRERGVLNDLFVSCGRPTLKTARPPAFLKRHELKYLRPVV